MSSNPAIQVRHLSKSYQLYNQPIDRLKQFLWRGKKQFYTEFSALKSIDFEINRGEVIGIVGQNGSGKSTLLQLICGTLTPTAGEVIVNGRIAALLELGAGFNPEFTGRENIFMSGVIMGLSEAEISQRFDEIVEFSGISAFIEQPVKTYSSGMYVRLAFSVAINVDPDILVIDEALSVGDGAFSRKSFDRIMTLKEAGKTILFCSHSLYQVDVLCNRAIWLNKGQMEMMDAANKVTNKYNLTLIETPKLSPSSTNLDTQQSVTSTARITNIRASINGLYEKPIQLLSEKSTLKIEMQFECNQALPTPSLALMICTLEGVCISSTSTYHDEINLCEHLKTDNIIAITFPSIPLLQGDYTINIYLCCEKALHVYDSALDAIQLHVLQKGTEQGFVMLPRYWNKP
jgi:lipopolysaccharide transport system ATP-binding protein